MDSVGSEADMKRAIENFCGTKLNSIAVIYQEGTTVEITGLFDFLLDSVKKMDSILKIKQIAKNGEISLY